MWARPLKGSSKGFSHFVHSRGVSLDTWSGTFRGPPHSRQNIKPIFRSPKTSSFKQDRRHPFKRGFGTFTTIVAISVLGCGSLAVYQSSKGSVESRLLLPRKEVNFMMAPSTLPGRPGNLTPTEEKTLKELWAATLKVFGVAPSPSENGINRDMSSVEKAAEVGSRIRSDTIGSTKGKKKRLSLFGRKQKESEDSGDLNGTSGALYHSPGATASSHHDGEDKYGQTKEFQHALASQSPEDLRAAFWSMSKHDHPDALLLRFLRARKWDVEKALIMLISTMHWRSQEVHVDDDIIKTGEGKALADSLSKDPAVKKEGEDFLAQMRTGKSFLHGVDKEGRPICCVRVRLHRQGEQSESSLERYTVYVIETARYMLVPPIDTAAILFDMTGFSLANMDYAPVKFMIKCFEANYPESLGVVLVHRSPWIFQSIWAIIKGWLDPVVASKVHFTKTVEELEQFIPRSNISKELGGDEDWTYRYTEPEANENDLMKEDAPRVKLTEERQEIVLKFEAATRTWIASPEANPTINKERDLLAEGLRENYWKLDPYIRARSLYDRIGTIKEGGVLDFYPKALASPTATIETEKTHQTNHETSADDVD